MKILHCILKEYDTNVCKGFLKKGFGEGITVEGGESRRPKSPNASVGRLDTAAGI